MWYNDLDSVVVPHVFYALLIKYLMEPFQMGYLYGIIYSGTSINDKYAVRTRQ